MSTNLTAGPLGKNSVDFDDVKLVILWESTEEDSVYVVDCLLALMKPGAMHELRD